MTRRRRAIAFACIVALIAIAAAIAAPDEAQLQPRSAAPAPATPIAAASGTPAPLAHSWSPPRNAPHVTVALASGGAIALPRSFLGFSIEVGDAVFDAHHLHLFAHAVDLIRIRGDGPQVLRVGGNSTDQSYWHRRLPVSRPPAFELGRTWLSGLRRIVDAIHARVILGVNAIADSPGMAASLARSVSRQLPPHALVGLEVGNEPDLYTQRFAGVRAASIFAGRTRPQRAASMTAAGYANTFASYAAALDRVARGVKLAGPAVANPLAGRAWLTGVIDQDRPALGVLTAHRYPLSNCFHTLRSPYFPTIGRLLSERASAGMAASVAPAIALAHSHGLELRLTEFNSVSCLGRLGVSNTFATALWAPDALLEMLRTGVDGVNLHLRTFSVNAPFLFTSGGFVARPAIYGLALFARAFGPGARLMPVALSGARLRHLKVWAVLVGRHELHLLVIDKSSLGVRMTVRLPGATGAATVQRLLAASVRSTHGVTLAGQSLGPNGQWVGQRIVERLTPGAAGYGVAVRGYSAALLTVRIGSRSGEALRRQGVRDHGGRLGHRAGPGARARGARGEARAVRHRRRAR
ncbi:MAG TPA: glycosyl hydrolase family 79 C-terminal domain-containing protein [Solirubrobacteraceae bacterium]|nr:glycosyl hydrolase family 79 C-terminal domain-containing protein [Solirubrobacteraceae bacterium]